MNTSELQYLPFIEQIVDKISETTQSNERHLFRVLLAYYMGKVSCAMGTTIDGWYNSLPTNIYSICLAESGAGKGFTVSTVEDRIIHKFKGQWLEDTFPSALTDGIADIASYRAQRRNTTELSESKRLWKEADAVGSIALEFSENSTSQGIRQIRHKIILANIGGINLQVDEIGHNLTKLHDVISLMLEMYDTGSAKDGITKNTSENKRFEYIHGYTPANLLLFGTHSSLFNGAEQEQQFMTMLEAGYARRSFFSFSKGVSDNRKEQTAEEAVAAMFSGQFSNKYRELSEHFESLADFSQMNRKMQIREKEAVYLMKYKFDCEKRSEEFKSFESTLSAEMRHRYFKVLKLAAATSFVCKERYITREHIDNAIKLAEESGKCLMHIVRPEKDFMRLAKYLAERNTFVTIADIESDLPCYTGAMAKKNDMMTAAIAYGYRNNILITRKMVDNILFTKGSALRETDLDKLIISVSADLAYDYEPKMIKIEDLYDLASVNNMNWCNHHFYDNHRFMDDLIEGFNMVVFDIDDGTPIDAVKRIFAGYYAFFYHTKRSTEEQNRYRLVLPISHVLELDREDYIQLMDNIIESLPIDVDIDSSSKQPEKKWLTNHCDEDHCELVLYDQDDEPCKLFDILPFIPRTHKNEVYVRERKVFKDMTNLQFWMVHNSFEGNRNKMMHRYAMVLVESGYSEAEIRAELVEIATKMKDGLDEREIDGTVMKTVKRELLKYN